MATEIRVPTLGESVSEATIGRWFKKPGDAVAADEPLVELETDKVTLEVNAPSAGTLGDIVAQDGTTVGPVFDPASAWGMAVVDVADAGAASALTAEDPIVRAGAGFRYEIYPVPQAILRGQPSSPSV